VDLVAARQRARQIAATLGFDEQDQTRIATVVSEMARNVVRYARAGKVEFSVATGETPALVITVTDRGPGIPNLDDILAGRYVSKTGMGIGITGARRLMDEFEITSEAGKGSTVVMKKRLPKQHIGREELEQITKKLARQVPQSPFEELHEQNTELLRALADLQDRQSELEGLNQELEDTNRGVLALYAELDEKAVSLRRADTLKTRFLSDMGHEFRTPVNSILALTRLLDEADLSAESRKQVSLIRRAAEDLESLLSDLLDLAKIEAGKVELRRTEFEIANLFSALRGMLRPLLLNRSVALVFDDTEGLPLMVSDEGKVSQILRNFISNALKFTEAGEIRVSAEVSGDGETVTFSVADTGIGIAPEDQDRIFEEFTQVDGPLQRRQKGTGLGLPLTRKLAALLGGSVRVESVAGVGSTFFASIPLHAPTAGKIGRMTDGARSQPSRPHRILIIDDDETARYTLGTFAARPGIQLLEAENGLAGIDVARREKPDIILLDLMMPGIGGHEVLEQLKDDATTSAIPVVMITSRFINEDERRQILGRAAKVIYKGDLSRELVNDVIDEAFKR
jgi:signal transduction histidine kinase